jgi:hypothetical protein
MTLYSYRSTGYITKFDADGNVEASYQTSAEGCTCPAGQRSTCRHRQMLPHMLAHNLADSQWFWDHDKQMATDFDGHQVALYETQACAPAEEDTEALVPAGQHTAAAGLPPIDLSTPRIIDPMRNKQLPICEPLQTVQPAPPWRRL